MAQDLTPAEADKMNRDRNRVERDFWQTLKATARKIPFIDDLVSVYYCALDPATPRQSEIRFCTARWPTSSCRLIS